MMAVGATGGSSAVISLKMSRRKAKKLAAKMSPIPPGAAFTPKNWEITGAVVFAPTDIGRYIAHFHPDDSALDGLVFIGPQTGWVGLARESKRQPFEAEFPASRLARRIYDKKFWFALFRTYGQEAPDKPKWIRFGYDVEDWDFLAAICYVKVRTIWPISVDPDAPLYGIQFAPGTKIVAKDPGSPKWWKKIKAAVARVIDLDTAGRFLRYCIMPTVAHAATAGWRAWVVANRRKGSLKEVIEDFLRQIPDHLKAFDKVFTADSWVGAD